MTDSLTTAAPGMPGAAGAGDTIRYMALPPYRASRVRDPTPPIRRVSPPRPRVEIADVRPSLALTDAAHVSLPVSSLSAAAGQPTGGGTRVGPERGGGGGAGLGGGTGPGGGRGEIFPPQARYSILPPLPRPGSVRGRTFRVHFWVDATGRVTRVAVTPPIPDAGYARRFTALMSQYTFTPARKPDGTATSGETVLAITL